MQIWDVLVVVVITNYEPLLRKLNRNESRKLARYLFAQTVAISDKVKNLTPHFQLIRGKRKITRVTVRDIFPRRVTPVFMNLAL